MAGLATDFRDAVRSARNNPGFSAVAVISLALGIGANAAIFSLIEAVMLRPLSVERADELVQVRMTGTDSLVTNPIWEGLRDSQRALSELFAYGRWRFDLADGGESRYAHGSYVSGAYFEILGVRAQLGRTLSPEDDQRGCAGAAVLSLAFWTHEYGARGDILGQTIRLNGTPMEIVGVAEPGFSGVDVGAKTDVFVSLCAEALIQGETSLLDNRSAPWLRVIGRPSPGLSARQAETQLKTLAPAVFADTLPQAQRAEQVEEYLRRSFAVESATNGISHLRTQYRDALFALMALAVLVLIVACANVASLLLIRSAAIRHESAIRLALGAGRARIVRHRLAESLLLSGIGAVFGIVLSRWVARALVAYLGVHLQPTLNLQVLSFALAVTLLTSVLVGIVPAWRSSRAEPQSALAAGARGVTGASTRFGLGKALVAGQLAFALVLLVSAGLMLATFQRLIAMDPGFDRDRVLTVMLDIRTADYPPERRLPAFRRVLDELRNTPGVRSAAAANIPPIGLARWTEQVVVEDSDHGSDSVYFNQVSDQYFETLGIDLLAGRSFDRRDSPDAPRTAIVNHRFAELFFGEHTPLGRQYRLQRSDDLSDPIEIVGVVADSKYGNLREEIPPTIYTAWNQDPVPFPLTYIAVRSDQGPPGDLAPLVRTAIARVDPAFRLESASLAGQLSRSIEREHLLAVLSTALAALVLLITGIGIYAAMAYQVTRRRKEMGIRVALGATQANLARMVLSDVSLIVVAGLVAGLSFALVTTRLLAGLVYGVTPTDLNTLVIASSLLAACSIGAAAPAVRSAAKQDPMIALREE